MCQWIVVQRLFFVIVCLKWKTYRHSICSENLSHEVYVLILHNHGFYNNIAVLNLSKHEIMTENGLLFL